MNYFLKYDSNKRITKHNERNMKKSLLLGLLILLAFTNVFSQGIGINSTGTKADSSAGLDIDFIDKGFLLPRMTQFQRDGIVNPATSLLIYQTDNTPGYYFNSGTPGSPVWMPINSGASSSSGWQLTGNLGTISGTNFIGTNDAQDLVFKTNNAERLRILSNGMIGIGIDSPDYTLSFDNSAARTISPNRNSIMGAAGSNFLLGGGFGATAGSTNQNGGDLYLKSGIATGTGFSNIYFQTAPVGSSGTSDNTLFNIGQLYTESSTKSDFKLYSPNGAKFMQLGTDQLNNVGQIYTTASGLELWSNSLKALTLDGSQNALFTAKVGIGTATPTSKLEISTGVANTSGLKFTNLNSSSPTTALAAILGLDGSGNVVVASSSGSLTSDLTGIIADVKSTNTPGGSSVAGWNTRVVNTELYDPNNIITLSNGTTGTNGTAKDFILQAGTYKIEVRAPYDVTSAGYNVAILRLQNITAGTTVATGTSSSTNNDESMSFLTTTFTLASTATFELQQYLMAYATYGCGYPANVTGVTEMYTCISIVKLNGSTSSAGIAANNGITLNGSIVQMGGVLTQATDIATGGNNLTFSGTGAVGIGTTSPSSQFSVGSGSQFQVNSTGNIIKINNVAYSWPSVQGTANQVLSNNGSGTLSWITVGSGVTGSGTADYLARWTASSTLGVGVTRDNNSTVGINAAPNASYRLFVDGASSKTAIYGNYNGAILGHLASANYGAFGQQNATLFGYLGGTSYGVYGQLNATQYGYLGGTYGAYGSYNGIYGYLGGSGYGVYGFNNNGGSGTYGYLGGTTCGAQGYFDANHYGRLGTSTQGVFGYSNGSASAEYGVYGQATGSPTTNGYGGYFLNTSATAVSQYGVSGNVTGNTVTGTKYGVHGSATGTATKNYGVYGTASGGTSNWAGYFVGSNVYIQNQIQIAGGTPGLGKVLTSDATGLATWQMPAVGTVTSVTATAPVSSTGGATPVISMLAATGSQNGYLSSTDWTTFNNKFTLPSLTSGSVIFSNGTTVAQDNTNFFWDNTNKRLGIGTATPQNNVEINAAVVGTSGLRLKKLPAGAVLFMSSTNDVAQNNSNFYFDATNYRLGVACGTAPNSTVQVGGSLATAIVTKSASYTASVSDYTILCSATLTISLPDASSIAGRIYVIKNIGTGTVTISRNGCCTTQTIDGLASQTLTTQYQSMVVQSDGTKWYIIDN